MNNPDRPSQPILKPILNEDGKIIGFCGPDGSADYASTPFTKHLTEQNNPADSNQAIKNQQPINQPNNQK